MIHDLCLCYVNGYAICIKIKNPLLERENGGSPCLCYTFPKSHSFLGWRWVRIQQRDCGELLVFCSFGFATICCSLFQTCDAQSIRFPFSPDPLPPLIDFREISRLGRCLMITIVGVGQALVLFPVVQRLLKDPLRAPKSHPLWFHASPDLLHLLERPYHRRSFVL